ncbi:MAG: hypothetical protein IPL62_17590 [Caulobacteraceae bacterium]|nr:hypothetical protein [Caulobacteraceae bacterium]
MRAHSIINPVLGAPLIGGAEHALCPPWAVLEWSARWSDLYQGPSPLRI